MTITTLLSADVVAKTVKEVLKKTKQKNANIMFKANTGHSFKIGDVGVDEDSNIYLIEADMYLAPIGFC